MPEQSWTRILRSSRARSAAIGLYILCVAGLISGYLWVSLAKVKYAAFLRAEPELEVGRPLAGRGQIIDAYLGRPLTRGEVVFGLAKRPEDALQEEPEVTTDLLDAEALGAQDADDEISFWGETQIEPGGLFHVDAELPSELTPGVYELSMRAKIRADQRDPQAEESYLVRRNIRVRAPDDAQDYWPNQTPRLRPDAKNPIKKPVQSSEGPIQIDLLPADAQVPRGLNSTVYLRTTRRDSGEPVSVEVSFDKEEGLNEGTSPASITTDELGLARLEISAATDLLWTVSTGQPPDDDEGEDEDSGADEPDEERSDWGKARLLVATVPAQFSLRLNQVLAAPGAEVTGRVDSLYREGGLMVDLYKNSAWVGARAWGVGADGSGVQMKIPPAEASALGEEDAPQFYRVQVYRSTFAVGSAWDVGYLLSTPDDSLSSYQRGAHALARHLASRADDAYFQQLADSDALKTHPDRAKLKLWTAALLQAMPRHLDIQAPLLDTRESGQAELDQKIAEVQARLKLLTAATLLIGLLVVLYLVLMGIRGYQLQQRMLEDVALETLASDDPDEAAQLINPALERWAVGAQIAVVIGALCLFVFALLMLLSYF